MVCYCCVKGCSNSNKKDPNSTVTFHAFPTNPELRQQWLRAIGRPSWEPPSYARICSAHFSSDQISQVKARKRILDRACPVNCLPLNSNFEASDVEVCRFCLASDVKIYSIREARLKKCMESFAAFNDNCNIEGLPQFVCYECGAQLMKFHIMLEKSFISQATLLDIFVRHGRITKPLIKKQNRIDLNLISSLQCYYETLTNYYEFKYDDKQNASHLLKTYSVRASDNNQEIEEGYKEENTEASVNQCHETVEVESFEGLEEIYINNDDFTNDSNDIDDEISRKVEVADCSNDFYVLQVGEEELEPTIEKDVKTKKAKSKNTVELNPDIIYNMKDHYDIVKLSQYEQIKEWQKSARLPHGQDNMFECDVCSKQFATKSDYQRHTIVHDAKRGTAECPVCKSLFKTEVLVRSHIGRTHANIYYCKACPLIFSGVCMARKHLRWHADNVHESTKDERKTDPENAAAEEFRCEQCNMSFKTEGARRIHLLTSRQHWKKPVLCKSAIKEPAVKNSCRRCGQQFSSEADLVSHIKAKHPKTGKPRSAKDYPKTCEHCAVCVGSRLEHWTHVRREHPRERGSYHAVLDYVCQYCGKRCQNITKLHFHELRHRSPTVKCEFCSKLFYDKYSLANHLVIHSEARPHCCHTCGRSFKQRSNLDRHCKKVHLNIGTYECSYCGKEFRYTNSLNYHVRSVHYKIPPPPRKRRTRTKGTVNID